jgi:DNA polymerase (family 10)
MTQRILNGLDHPKVRILGHPTARKLGFREGLDADWEKIFEFCQKNNKFLEINSWPERLDLPDVLIREAINLGVKLVINSDSHEASQMDLVKFGVWTARRGWARQADIINTLSYNDFRLMIGGE